ncbi:MAG: 30S ribosomal protein S16 [Candidatus Harrisonbacteria bacterium]|nr:30S ribosomal protein S16 [Candidatus Harrisonbacteria bacterium]
MLVLKLKRIGKKHQAAYRLIVNERRDKNDGKVLEDLGYYNPHSKETKINADRVKHWISVGAQKTDTVNNLLVKNAVIEGKKIAVHSRKKAEEAKK